MDDEILARARAELHKRGLHGALVSDLASVTWLTGHAPSADIGLSQFDSPMLVWLDDDALVIVVSATEAAPATTTGAEVWSYTATTPDEPLPPGTALAEVLRGLLRTVAAPNEAYGFEAATLPVAVRGVLLETGEQLGWTPIDRWTVPLRMVKTERELTRLRAALSLSDLAQDAVDDLIAPGMMEISFFHQIRSRIEAAAGGHVPLYADFVGGWRTGNVGGLPGEYVLQPNDPLLADIVVRLNGYWGDTCNVHFAGEPSVEMRRLYTSAREVLQYTIDAVRPGVIAGAIDEQARNRLRRSGFGYYPHHTGHGIGVTYHEEPRIVPHNQIPLVPGMVIALEPALYVPDVGGVRIEDVVLVTDNGCEVLTKHRKL